MKKHLLFNQLFGTEGSPNQTGETLTPSGEQAMTVKRNRRTEECPVDSQGVSAPREFAERTQNSSKPRRPSDEQRSRISLLYPCYTFARAWKYAACMLMVLVLSVGEMWG